MKKTCPVCKKPFTIRPSIEHLRVTCSRECRAEYKRQGSIERFWEKVERRGPDECWPWKAASNPRGYGRFRYGLAFVQAHRLSWMIAHGEWPPSGLCVLHACDNPECVNPSHLRLGTGRENSRDMVEKGRSAMGGRNSGAKLAEEDVLWVQIKRLLGWSRRSLANEYGVTWQTIWLIDKRLTWRHV